MYFISKCSSFLAVRIEVAGSRHTPPFEWTPLEHNAAMPFAPLLRCWCRSDVVRLNFGCEAEIGRYIVYRRFVFDLGVVLLFEEHHGCNGINVPDVVALLPCEWVELRRSTGPRATGREVGASVMTSDVPSLSTSMGRRLDVVGRL